ncbi:MAG TPA: threonine ammonia-lyase [Candidatus Nitrosocosmicus sp.]|nr:threonine ammonia-lyase [Candidatus Nitrosocosmicus sp.]
MSTLDLNYIKNAQKILSQSNIRKIDMIRSNTFSNLCGNNVFLKLECLQKTGSFKVRGAITKINNLSKDLKQNGVIAASAGNHAQGVAYASSMSNIPCTIVMPQNASPAKISATKSYGAKVILYGNDYDESSSSIKEIAEKENKTIIPAFEDQDVIAGQGTLGLEIIEDLENIDEIYIPVGGGGLISGIALVLKSLRPSIRIIGVESEGYPTMKTSIEKNKITKVQTGYSIADGIAVKTPGQLTFNLVKEHVDEIVLIDDISIVKTMFLLMERSKIVAEPAGAASLAYIISNKRPKSNNKNIVSLISGGNVDMYLLGQVVAKGLMQTGRLVKVFVDLPDKPGTLKNIVDEISMAHINIVEVVHDRLSSNIPAGTAGVYLSLELENKDQSNLLVDLFKEKKINFKIIN